MTIELPEKVVFILNKLENKGYTAYAVGGCMRDAILGKQPNDWDICTSALPLQTKEVFAGLPVIETGLQHGTVTLLLHHEPFEITTFRIDGLYEDNRRPASVAFTTKVEHDLARRDFTMNAIAYNPSAGIVDPFGGEKDIASQLIRCVGKADHRFKEDALRVMRALRFSSVLGFSIEKETATALFANAHLLANIAIERISDEFCKLLQGKNVEQVLQEYKAVIATIIPEAQPMFGFAQNNPYHMYDVWEHTVKSVASAKENKAVRLALFFHDIAKPHCYTQDEEGVGHFYQHGQKSTDTAREVLRRMRFDNETIDTVKSLVLYHDTQLTPDERTIKRWLNRLGEENLRLLLEVKKGDVMGQAEQYREPRLAEIEILFQLLEKVLAAQACFSLKDLAVNGADIIKAGVPAGPKVGEVLQTLLNKVIEDELQNEKQTLLHFVQTNWQLQE